MKRPSRKRGVSVQGNWIAVPLNFLRSRAAAEMSPLASKLLIDVLSMLGPNASGNGGISLAPSIMVVRGWKSRASLGAAVRELEAHGLLIKARQGGRLDCSLWALTLYPLDVDPKKIDIRPGAFMSTDYMHGGELAGPPSEAAPATWRVPRKTKTLAPLGNKVGKVVPLRNKVKVA